MEKYVINLTLVQFYFAENEILKIHFKLTKGKKCCIADFSGCFPENLTVEFFFFFFTVIPFVIEDTL